MHPNYKIFAEIRITPLRSLPDSEARYLRLLEDEEGAI